MKINTSDLVVNALASQELKPVATNEIIRLTVSATCSVLLTLTDHPRGFNFIKALVDHYNSVVSKILYNLVAKYIRHPNTHLIPQFPLLNPLPVSLTTNIIQANDINLSVS